MNLEDFANIDFNNPFQTLEKSDDEGIVGDVQKTDVDHSVGSIEGSNLTTVKPSAETDIDDGSEKSDTANTTDGDGKEESDSTEWTLTDEQAPEILNALANLGMITDIPENINPEEIDAEAAKEILTYRDNQLVQNARMEGAKAAQNRIVGKLNETLQRAVIHNLQNPNMDDSTIINYLQSMDNVNKITALTPENNAEEIVREAYKTQGYRPAEINEKVADLIELDKLTKEAEILKPKLDAKAQSIVQAQEEQAQRIAQFEATRQTELHQRTMNLLQEGNLGGIPLDREMSQFLYSTIMNNEVPVDIKGRRVEMGALEALVMNNKYSNEPEALERVALAAIVLKDGIAKLNEHLAKKVVTKETEKIVKQFKFSNNRKTSSTSSRTVSQDEEAPFTIKF